MVRAYTAAHRRLLAMRLLTDEERPSQRDLRLLKTKLQVHKLLKVDDKDDKNPRGSEYVWTQSYVWR